MKCSPRLQKVELIQSPDGVERSARDTLSYSQQVFAYPTRSEADENESQN